MTHEYAVGSAQLVSLELLSARRTAEEVHTVFPSVEMDLLRGAFGPSASTVWSFNMALVRLPETTVLVDTGFSFGPGGPGADTRTLLGEAGLDAADVDIVVITHGHGDHVGGLLEKGDPAFARAELVMSEIEYHFWMGDEAAGQMGADAVSHVRAAFSAYADRTRLISGDERITGDSSSSLSAVQIPGHTPGHLGLTLESGGERLMVLADTLHTELQLAHPEWSPRFDVDAALASESRRAILRRISADGTPVHLYHLAFPGIGRVVSEGDAYRWAPVAEGP